jgi:hypothetical protein
MRTQNELRMTVGVVLAAASLVVGTLTTSFASTTHSRTSVRASHTSVRGPYPNAPRGDIVQGLQTGRRIPVNTPANTRRFLALHRQMRNAIHGKAGRVATIHEYVGASFDNLANFDGAQATQSVSTRIHVGNSGTTLYMPTMYPNASCIEVTTAYFFGSRAVAAWDWCKAIRFVAQVTINRRFVDTYTVNHNYTTQIVRTNPSINEWTAYLYNFKTASWDTLFTQSGTGQTGLVEGWDLYELYTNLMGNGQSYACVDLKKKRVESQDIQVEIGSTWNAADPAHAGNDYDVPLADFHCNSLHYSMLTQFSHWKAKG